ncbi:hypothetical protein DFP72DRAFT_223323 [Ephemerocybe angulata]|uniref:Uncharacterized protein n=1 Tax=Ephemerocybe angulata TaxID=980116 RepID=A0A8H6M6M2_9AGAR|nr:hypothetical protein DFP72DRAFT_223323 [Tulosesus angulatus]
MYLPDSPSWGLSPDIAWSLSFDHRPLNMDSSSKYGAHPTPVRGAPSAPFHLYTETIDVQVQNPKFNLYHQRNLPQFFASHSANKAKRRLRPFQNLQNANPARPRLRALHQHHPLRAPTHHPHRRLQSPIRRPPQGPPRAPPARGHWSIHRLHVRRRARRRARACVAMGNAQGQRYHPREARETKRVRRSASLTRPPCTLAPTPFVPLSPKWNEDLGRCGVRTWSRKWSRERTAPGRRTAVPSTECAHLSLVAAPGGG